ncbi:MAG: lipid-A-disaccharide synthase [Crocinitomicaceae bacterium]|nr:lipid-A-disaccharide synthase [Crocinitomicaceae bacterium]MDG1777506.1 lipid-A-disaccharide synthase [Crocinitomicaceae bacterium]
MSATKVYIIAGEPSGDLHASNMMQAILDENPRVDFRFWGGDKMEAIQKNGLVKHIRDLAFMGFIEVVMNLKTILRNIKDCKSDIETYNPDAIVLIDYPGFNLRIAEWAKSKGIKVYYYISPQIWAWKKNRVHKIKKVVDHMFVILPFEEAFYKKFNYKVEYVGHPLLDEISKFNFSEDKDVFLKANNMDDRPIIAVLPGSRKQEVSVKLPIMIEALKDFTSHQIVVAGAPTLTPAFYASIDPSITIVFDETYRLLANSSVAVVTSGTATLETALFKVPELVCYKASEISYQIAKRLIKVDYISLVNLIMNRAVVKELIQKSCNATFIRAEVERLIHDSEYRDQINQDYNLLDEMLGGGGASKKVAQSLLKTIHD